MEINRVADALATLDETDCFRVVCYQCSNFYQLLVHLTISVMPWVQLG
jgi:hypothetical protein